MKTIATLFFFLIMAFHSGAQQTHCAKDDYPDPGKIFFNGPSVTENGMTLSFEGWIIPWEKIIETNEGFIILHPSHSNECVEEKSLIINQNIKTAVKNHKSIVISLTMRNGKPDAEWKFVMIL